MKDITYTYVIQITATNEPNASYSPISYDQESQKHFGKITNKTAVSILKGFVKSFEKANGVIVLAAKLVNQNDFCKVATYNLKQLIAEMNDTELTAYHNILRMSEKALTSQTDTELNRVHLALVNEIMQERAKEQ